MVQTWCILLICVSKINVFLTCIKVYMSEMLVLNNCVAIKNFWICSKNHRYIKKHSNKILLGNYYSNKVIQKFYGLYEYFHSYTFTFKFINAIFMYVLYYSREYFDVNFISWLYSLPWHIINNPSILISPFIFSIDNEDIKLFKDNFWFMQKMLESFFWGKCQKSL